MIVNSLQNKRILIMFLTIAFIAIFFMEPKKLNNRLENINYKLLNENDINSMFMKTNQSKVTFYLQITPDINKSYPALFTIFMNGRQIQCLWDKNYTDVFFYKY